MSFFDGRIERLNKLDGKILKKVAGLKVSVFRIGELPKCKIGPIPTYTGKLYGGITFGSVVTKLKQIYRFIAAKASLMIGHDAKVYTTEAAEIEAQQTVSTIKKSALISGQVEAIVVDNKQKVRLISKLVAYRRAGLAFARRIVFANRVKLTNPRGAVAAYREIMQFNRAYDVEAAKSVTVPRKYSKIATEKSLVGTSAPTIGAAAESKVFERSDAQPSATENVVEVCINTATTANQSAKMVTWLAPVVVDGTLILRQVHSATPEKKKLVVS